MSARGVRFAPSPTGRFHVGNLRTAWISERIAREIGEPWTARFEDIDAPRVVAGARDAQLADMAAIGLKPDEIVVQSSRRDRHYSLFAASVESAAVYPCGCSRKEVQDALAGLASAPHGAVPIYTGHCRGLGRGVASPGAGGVAWRFRAADATGAGDFIVARTALAEPDAKSFVPAYHWACAIDDHDGEYRLLVRAWDLAGSTPFQREIHRWVAETDQSGRLPAAVFHTALVTRNDGHRLEKRTAGVTLAELIAAGIPPEEIVRRFDASFSEGKNAFLADAVFGETQHEITLASLGF